ncbi:SLAP domain-containing protein [Bombilactobacillus thymidiniphilus]|uniref:SLAP domain-containing protein n=1 Tax=Bombilactobacillus thymidiniphilus TaxID=2923363 RepID=A0ABY4PBJ3_9LACO|nr:SLAP domain-containing protein [Bombilactobacillus thymidiniphilus]UQS83143.1 SLAP domain-containing protein [Bombilactobacillus thymidiniphilus]
MKKSSLMGASVVAAALLAVAPVAAPAVSAVSGTQVVKADNAPTDAQKDAAVSKALSAYNFANSKDESVSVLRPSSDGSVPAELTVDGFDKDGTTLADFFNGTSARNAFAKYFQTGALAGKDDVAALAAASGYNVKVTYSDGTNNLGQDDLSTAISKISADNKGSLKETVTVTAKNTDGSERTVATLPMTLNFTPAATPAPDPAAETTSLYVSGKTDFTPAAGDSVYPYLLNSSFKNEGGTIYNQNADSVGSAASGKMYVADASGNATGDALTSSDKFEAGKTYTQDISIATNDFNLSNNDVDRNPLIFVNGKPVAADATGNVTLKRTFTVPKGDGVNVTPAPAKEEAVDGVVVINSDVAHGNAQLYDEAGNPIVDWVLPAGTPWYTGMKRTILKDGQAYYQVSTHAYVKASQVKYIPEADWQAQTAKADITNVNGVFTVKVDGSDILPLKTVALNDAQNSFVSSDRVLNGGTSWAVDQKAVLNGETYYRVSTNLWVRASSNGISNGNFVER